MRRVAASLVLAVLAASACSGDDKLSFGSLAGTWDATEYLIIDQADANNTYELLAGLGIDFAIQIRASGIIVVLINGSVVDSITAALDADVIDLSTRPDDEYRISRSGNTMTWTGLFTYPYDVDGDGTDETAAERIRWARR